MALAKLENMPEDQARLKIWMKDSKGLIVQGRGSISEHKAPYAHEHEHMTDLGEIVKTLKPTCLIGAAAIGGAFTKEIIEDMTEFNKNPIIFALSNPTHKAECTAEQAYEYSKGKCVFASGSPFPTYVYNGQTFEPGQGNNAYIFPGVGLGVIMAGIHHISENVFLSAAEALAHLVTDKDLEVGRMYPPLSSIKECSLKIAIKIAEDGYKDGTATTYPKPQNIEDFIKEQLYDYNYDNYSSIPSRYTWDI